LRRYRLNFIKSHAFVKTVRLKHQITKLLNRNLTLKARHNIKCSFAVVVFAREQYMPKKFTNPDSETNIRRIDSKGTHGFQVHFDRQGNIYTQFFSDTNYGGKENARKEARYFRDQLKEKIPKSITGSPAWTGKARSNTGKMGVSFTREIRNGREEIIVQTTVRVEKNVAMNRKFRAYGDDLSTAIQQAVEWRNAVIAERIEREGELAQFHERE